MRSKQFLAVLVVAMGLSVGCEEPAKPRRPPAESTTETTDELRERRRSGSATADEPRRTEDDRYTDFPSREERRRPDFRNGESSAADAAEDQRDADADRRRASDDE